MIWIKIAARRLAMLEQSMLGERYERCDSLAWMDRVLRWRGKESRPKCH